MRSRSPGNLKPGARHNVRAHDDTRIFLGELFDHQEETMTRAKISGYPIVSSPAVGSARNSMSLSALLQFVKGGATTLK